jgi:ribonuclease J
MLNPEHIIPAHGSREQLIPMVDLAKELGYKPGKECHLLDNGEKLKL